MRSVASDHGCVLDLSLLGRVEVLPQVDQTGLVLNNLQYLSLTIHHIFVFKNLLYSHYLSCFLDLSLHTWNS